MKLDTTPPWLPADLSGFITNKLDSRELMLYRQVLAQFRITASARYAPKAGKTFCNIYVWDCTRALNCEIPHWVKADGSPTTPGNGNETTANSLLGWLRGYGKAKGWAEVNEHQAHGMASEGLPTVAVWKNPKGHGHIAMVLPGPGKTLHIAQAGAKCLFDAPLASGFGGKIPLYFSHP